MQDFHTEMTEEVVALKTRMDKMVSNLDFKHGEELHEMRSEISKLYGINFKYVSMKDLGMSMDMLARLRQEIMEREHVPLWKRIYNYWRPKIIYASLTIKQWIVDAEEDD